MNLLLAFLVADSERGGNVEVIGAPFPSGLAINVASDWAVSSKAVISAVAGEAERLELAETWTPEII